VVVIGVDGAGLRNCALANYVLDSHSAWNVQLLLAAPISFLEFASLELLLVFAIFSLVGLFPRLCGQFIS